MRFVKISKLIKQIVCQLLQNKEVLQKMIVGVKVVKKETKETKIEWK